MELIYLGTQFSRELINEDGSAFSSIPYVVLHNRATRDCIVADSVVDTSEKEDGTVYTFTYEKVTTKAMLQGVYELEVYEDYTMTKILDCRAQYRAVESAAAIVTPETPENTSDASDGGEESD